MPATSQKSSSEGEMLRKRLASMTKEELVEMTKRAKALEKALSIAGPKNDDELHAWVKRNLGLHIPRVSVCSHHNAPFDFLADLYFERTQSALLMANRGGSKTFLVALLHLINSLFKPGIESCTVGAIEQQARRAYMHLQKLLEKYGSDQVAAAIQSETRFRNGSRVEILPGTINAVNGPHPQKVHADEVELMDAEVFDESRNMSQGARINGKLVKAQDIITSTRKRGHGQMQALLNEIAEAKLNGNEPPYELYQWCIFEAAERVPNCQVADPNCADKCPCHDVVKGRWENGSSRTLRDVCQGRLARSDGWIPLNDIINTFTKTSVAIWEAQQECIKPSLEGLVVPQFARERQGIRRWFADPVYGPIFMSVDFGGTNPHAVNWYQLLRHEIEATNFQGQKVRLREGSLVCFDEIYRAEIGNWKLAKLIVERELRWKEMFPRWKVLKRFADPASKAARLDFAKHDPPLPTVFRVTREQPEHIKAIVNLFEDERFYVDTDRCPMFCEEIEAWHYPDKKPEFVDDPDIPVDDFNHCMSNFRYGVANILSMEQSRKSSKAPAISDAHYRNNGTSNSPVGAGGKLNGLPRSEQWRAGLGAVGGIGGLGV